jgi:asparagine synthetase B (glutamine-hydrolysing)
VSWRLSCSTADPTGTLVLTGLAIDRRGALTVALHGHLFDTGEANPAAFVADAIEQKGLRAALRDLRGVFVVAIADAASRELRVARDPLGAHPLFFARTPDGLIAGESARDLREAPGVPRGLNRAALADHLCHRWPSTTETFFEGIERVPPGSMIEAAGGTCRVVRYWDPVPPGEPVAWASDDEVAGFGALFNRAIDRPLSLGPAGVFLSGGLDSISVAAGAADRARAQGRRPPLALSLAIPDPGCDERDMQTSVARGLDLPQVLLPFDEALGEQGLLAAGAGMGAHFSNPLLNIWAPAYAALATRATAQGVRVILTGSGGDEWLSVSPYLSADLISRGDARGWASFVAAFMQSYQHPIQRHVRLLAWTFGLRPLVAQTLLRTFPAAWGARRVRRMSAGDPDWISPDPALRKLQRDRAAGALEDGDPPQGFYLREVRTGLAHPLTSWELEEYYEFGNRLGIRILHPYWDPDLVDMLYRTPPLALLAGGRAKGLVRKDLAARFPALGLASQRKVSATGFYQRRVRDEMGRVAAQLGPCRALAELGVITAAAAQDYGREGFGSATNQWDLMNLETWVRAVS